MTVGGRRSGVPSGEPMPHVMSLAHSMSGGHRQQQRSSIGSRQLGLERAAQGTGALWLAAVLLQWRRHCRGTGRGGEASDPTFLIKQLPSTAARRTPNCSLQCIELLDNFTSSPPTKRCSVLFLVTVLYIFSPKYVPKEAFKMTTRLLRRNTRILVINPNSSHDMTHGMEIAIRSMDLPDV